MYQDGDQTLSLDRFKEFVMALKQEVHTLEVCICGVSPGEAFAYPTVRDCAGQPMLTVMKLHAPPQYCKVKGDADMVTQRMFALALTQHIRNKNVRERLSERADLVASPDEVSSLLTLAQGLCSWYACGCSQTRRHMFAIHRTKCLCRRKSRWKTGFCSGSWAHRSAHSKQLCHCTRRPAKTLTKVLLL
jgi:hypothetical protein